MSIPFNYSIHSNNASPIERFVGSLFDFSKTRYVVLSKKPIAITETSTLLTLQEKIEKAPFKQNALKVAALLTGIIPLIALIYKIVQFKKWSSSTYVRIQSATDEHRHRILFSSTLKIPSINEKTKDPIKQAHLALQYLFGAGVALDEVKAKEFLNKALQENALQEKNPLAILVDSNFFRGIYSEADLLNAEKNLTASVKSDPIAKMLLADLKEGQEKQDLVKEALSTKHWFPMTKASLQNITKDITQALPFEKIKLVSSMIADEYFKKTETFQQSLIFYQYECQGNATSLLATAATFLRSKHLVEARSFVEQAVELGDEKAQIFAWSNEDKLQLTDKLLNSPTLSKKIKIKYLIHIYEASSSETINTRDFYGKKAVDFGSKEFELKDDGHYYLKPNE